MRHALLIACVAGGALAAALPAAKAQGLPSYGSANQGGLLAADAVPTLALSGAAPSASPGAAEYAAYRARAQTPQPHGVYFGQPLKLSFRDLAMQGGIKPYRVCVVDGGRKCYSRTFHATPNADWDTFIHRPRQNSNPIMIFWYVGKKVVWTATVVALGE